MTTATVQTIVADLIRAKASMTAENAEILERKVDGILRALMRGQTLNAGVAADDARHDRRVHQAKPLYAIYFQLRVDHCHRIRSHLACAYWVINSI